MLASSARRNPSTSILSLAGAAVACAALVPATVHAAAGPHACAPPGAARSADVARALNADGTSEITEFTAGGGYRVTRCDKGGRAVVSQTVSPIAGPDGATVLVPTERAERGVTVAMLYGDPADPRWAAEFGRSRAAIAAQVIPPTVAAAAPPAALPLPGPPATAPGTPGTPAGPGATDGPRGDASTATRERPKRPAASAGGGQVAVAAVAGDACTNSQFAIWETRWGTRDYDYFVNRSRFNYNDTSVASLVDRAPQLGQHVQQLRPQRHHEPRRPSRRLDRRDDPYVLRRAVDRRQGQPGQHLPRRARVHVAVLRRDRPHERDRPALQRGLHVLERRRVGCL